MNPSYYILGSKYKLGDYYQDVYPYMIKKNAVSIGFAWKHNLSLLYGKPEFDIVAKLTSLGEPPESYSPHRLFLNLKPGDLIAIKGSGSPVGNQPRLVIIAYAVVVERNGKVYQHDPEEFPKGLGHLINVDFIENNTHLTLPLGYGRTIHKLLDSKRINQVFSYYSNYNQTIPGQQRKGTKKKNVSPHLREIRSSSVVDPAHDRLQQAFYESLVAKYGEDMVQMEWNYVDVVLNERHQKTFFEIKPFRNAMQCLRDGFGQIIEYSWTKRTNHKDKIKLVVVGNAKPTKAEQDYIEYLKSNLSFNFDYEFFKPK